MAGAQLRRLHLTRFRSYDRLDLSVEGRLVALSGPNGAGKTNLLEALSLLAPGRGLRRAQLAEMAAMTGDGSFAVAAELDGVLGPVRLGTGIEGPQDQRRKCRVDGEPAPSAAAFADHLSIVWLLPAMDGLFTGPAGERRRFLDRLVLAADPAHAARVGQLERALRSRNRLLEGFDPDPRWCDALELELAELAVAVAAARGEMVHALDHFMSETIPEGAPFPRARLRLEGALEAALGVEPASAVEDAYRARLRSLRARDRAAGRTTEGPHLSDLAVTYADKDIPARSASTGEQKALLIGLVLAQAQLVEQLTGFAPLLLLDEIAAHLDPARRATLYETLLARPGQVWLTGADPLLFAPLGARAEHLTVRDSAVIPLG
jgi:DNA replication and repair protein RecF